MKINTFFIAALYCVLLLVDCAPVKDHDTSAAEDNGGKVVVKSTDESELKDLQAKAESMESKPKEKSNVKGVEVVKTETLSENVVNGQKESHSEVETKVMKPGTNKVVADVAVKSDMNQNENEAPKVFTEVDIPDQGIAEKYEGLADEKGPARNPMDFTPTAVAEYLLVSGDLDGFYKALEDLVTAKVMSVEEAKSYEEAVEREYQILLMELEEKETEDYYNDMDLGTPSKRAGDETDEEDMSAFNLDSMVNRINMQSEIEKEQEMEELEQALVADYLEKNGNVENGPYQEILENMDEQEIRGVIKVLADALMEELGPGGENEVSQEGVPETAGDAEVQELNEIAKTMEQSKNLESGLDNTEGDMEQMEDKKSRTSEEHKEIDDKKEKKDDDKATASEQKSA